MKTYVIHHAQSESPIYASQRFFSDAASYFHSDKHVWLEWKRLTRINMSEKLDPARMNLTFF